MISFRGQLIDLWTTACVSMCLCLSACAAGLSAKELDMRVQIDWWGGTPQAWDGLISIDQGRFSDLELLGFDTATPGSMNLRRRQLVIQQESQQKYNGAIVSIRGDEDSNLRLEFVAGGETRAKVFNVRFKSLIDLNEGAKSFELDGTGNRIWLRRAPGDHLRVKLKRPHLVFHASEAWSIDIEPHRLPKSEREPKECRLQLSDSRGRQIWSQAKQIESDGSTISPIANVDIPVPATEGVYTLSLKLVAPAKRFAPPFRSETQVAQRSIQFVVIASERPATSQNKKQTVLEFDPAEDRWWDRLKLLPQWSLVPGLRSDGPLANHKTRKRSHHGKSWVSIPQSGWQAYPLPIDNINQRHELTIEYPGDLAQNTTFSIVEPDSAGKVLPIELDSGIRIRPEDVDGIASRPPKFAKHTVPFWPSTKSPLLLVTNVDQESSSTIGRIRVTQTANSLPELAPNRSNRKLIANFDRPLFLENFSAIESRDPKTSRSYEDWSTFYNGTTRMTEYLRRNGFDGVAISCFAEGSSLYPDNSILPTPKYDRGIFFSDGRDPLRKDVLEMMLRVCDREKLTFIPSFEFTTLLPHLEQLLRNPSYDNQGLQLINNLGATYEPERNSGSYNPLDARVQKTVIHVIRSVVRRYGRHPSFGGIQLNVTPDSFVQLPGLKWGLDQNTLSRFRNEAGVKIPDPNHDLVGARKSTISKSHIDAWQAWRCEQIAKFYGEIREEVARHSTKAHVYINLSSRMTDQTFSDRHVNSPLETIDVMKQLEWFGIDVEKIGSHRGLVVPRPRRLTSNDNSLANELELIHSDEVAAKFRNLPLPATQFQHQPIRKRLSSFESLSPFGKDKTYMSLVAHIAPSGARYRERFAHALASNDSLTLLDGGWMLPLGQEAELLPFSSVYRSLPAIPFVAPPNKNVRVRPLVIRQRRFDGELYCYVVNDSPWNVGTDLRIRSELKSLGIRRLDSRSDDRLDRSDGVYTWSIDVRPYELVAVAFSDPNAQILEGHATLPPDVDRGLEDRISALNARIRYLNAPKETTPLHNADFELDADGSSIAGWHHRANGRTQVALADGYESRRSVRLMSNDRPVSFRSETFPMPQSDGLAIEFAAKLNAVSSRTSPRTSTVEPPGIQDRQLGIRVQLEHEEQPIAIWESKNFRITRLDDGWMRVILPFKTFRQRLGKDTETELSLTLEALDGTDIQIDNVRMFDTLLLDSTEIRDLTTKISRADYMRRNGFYGDCHRFLDSYWPRYLMQKIPAAPKAARPTARRPAPRKKPVRTSDRIKRYFPRIPGFR